MFHFNIQLFVFSCSSHPYNLQSFLYLVDIEGDDIHRVSVQMTGLEVRLKLP